MENIQIHTDPDTIIRFEGITKQFGSFVAVDHLNLEIKRGEIMGFLGPNGAGKSTTMKMLAGLLVPTEGRISVKLNGTSHYMDAQNKDQILDRLGFLIEHPEFYDHLSPRQVLTYFAKLKGYPREKIAARVEDVLHSMNLSEWIDKPIKTFSSGMKQKTGIASAIIHDPDIVVLDEPQTGLDPKARKEMRDLLVKLRDQGKTIFLSSHILYELSELADRFAIINHGKLLVCDTIQHLEEQSKRSIIRLETLTPYTFDSAQEQIKRLTPQLQKISGLDPQFFTRQAVITYNKETSQFEIQFNGHKEVQFEILKTLLAENISVIEYSVPKAGLLEQLYLSLVQQADELQQKTIKSAVAVKNVF